MPTRPVRGSENLSRTLSIEWFRHAVTAGTDRTGGQDAGADVAARAAFLASPSSAYFSRLACSTLRGA